MKIKMVLAMALVAVSVQVTAADTAFNWQQVLSGEQRSDANKARDGYRHPQATLQFFGLEPGMTVAEIAPGGGWYTEMLAPLMQGQGTYYAAHYALNGGSGYSRKSLGKYLQKLGTSPDTYQEVVVTQLQPPAQLTVAPAASVDLVVAFRNFHSWMRADTAAEVLAAIYTSLKPGGTFGLVQHRAKFGTPVEQMKESGYVTEEHVLALVRAAGFELSAQSDININAKDSADHPGGVWALPPALTNGEVDRDKYLAIGESDRMTLKFTKPKD